MKLIAFELRSKISNFSIHHNLPCVDWQVSIVERPVKLLLSHRLIGRVVVWRKVFVRKGLCCCDALLGVEDQHSLEEVDCYEKRQLCPSEGGLRRIPKGSALLNLSFKGCLSRLGNDCTNRNVYGHR
jgi:hypothetical protein